MGRPIKSKYFGIRKGVGVGGETVASVTIGSPAPESTQTITVSFSAPQIAGGTTAAGTVVKTGNTVTSVTITQGGSGYTSAPTVTFTGTSVANHLNGTAVLSSTVSNVIHVEAYVPALNGGSSGVAGDILEQVASKKYRVQTSQGTGTCLLTTATGALTAGKVRMVAEDTNGSTYYVKKLTARRAILSQSTVSTAFLFDNNEAAGWNLTAAATGVVKIRSR